MNRRRFLQLASSAAAASAVERAIAADAAHEAFYSLRIAPVSVELAPGKVVRTIGYNGQSPGPLLRMREGAPVTVKVTNATDHPELVHWHGLQIGSSPDGAMEEGSPMIAPGATLRYRFTPKPAGTRWYHTHTTALNDLHRATYTGQFGFLLVEPARESGAYDQEVFLAVHHWEPSFVEAPETPEIWPEIVYRHASFNDKLLGAAEPIRVRTGQRVLFHFLNAGATENVLISFPGHRFHVVALDGNPVPNPASVEVLSLAVAERIDAVVEMTAPGTWILGSLNPMERRKGLGIVIEYGGRGGAAQWQNPATNDWSYARFSALGKPVPEADEIVEMMFEKKPEGLGLDHWTINGRSFPDIDPIYVEEGKRYRLRMMNASGCAHPVHLHRHSFELVRVNQIPVSGVYKDTARVERYSAIEADFVANNPGPTLFHCHQQFHMDYGFMQLFRYRTRTI